MEDKFIKVIDYIKELQLELDSEEQNEEAKLLAIIKYAILTDNYYHGSIIFTKEDNKYVVSNIQKHSYAWLLQGKTIDVNYIINCLTELNIDYSFEYFQISDHTNDYELSFKIPKLQKKKVL